MTDFKTLQAKHLELLQKQEQASSTETIEEARGYIQDVIQSSAEITSSLEREQLRANLRYWATVVAEAAEEYPNIELLPAAKIEYGRKGWPVPAIVGTGGLIVVGLICAGVYALVVQPRQQAVTRPTEIMLTNTAVALGLTETAEISQFTATPVPSNTPTQLVVLPTVIPGFTVSPTPTAASIAFDRFDGGCVDALRWQPIEPVIGSPPDTIDATNCWVLSPAHRFTVAQSSLAFTSTGFASDALLRIDESCTFTKLEVVISGFSLSAFSSERNVSGFVGFAVDRPKVKGMLQAPVGIWLAGRITPALEEPTFLVFANQEKVGQPDLPTQQTLLRISSGQRIQQIVLGFRLEGGEAFATIDGVSHRLSGIEMGTPFGFRLAFGTTSGATLATEIEEVRILWDPNRMGSSQCALE